MKSDNKKLINALTLLLILVFGLGISSIIGSAIVFQSNGFFLVGFALLFCGVIGYSQLRYIEFDCEGEVIALRSYHPLQSRSHLNKIKMIELPKQQIKYYKIKKNLFSKKLILTVYNERRNREMNLPFSLSQTNNLFINKIKESLTKFTDEQI